MNQILTDEEVQAIYKSQEHRSAYDQFRAIEAAILSKMNSAEPVAWITPDGEGWRIRFELPVTETKLGWSPLYEHPPAPSEANVPLTGEGKTNQLADFIHRFKRHVGGDGEFWLHELENFYYGEAASLSDTLSLYAANTELRQQLSAAQASETELLKPLERFANYPGLLCDADYEIARVAIAAHKARKDNAY